MIYNITNGVKSRRIAVLAAVLSLLLLTLTGCTSWYKASGTNSLLSLVGLASPWYQAYGINSEEDLGKLSSVPGLMLALKSANVGARVKAAEALEAIGPDAKDAAPDLILALEDESDDVRQAAADALEKIKLVDPEYKDVSVQVQITRLNSNNWMVRRAAADKLAEMGPTAAKAVPALILALRDNSDWYPRYDEVRRAAVRALGEIGFDARAANPALIKILESDDYDLRLEAVRALGKIGPKQSPDVIQALTRMLDAPEGFDLRRWGVNAVSIGTLPPGDPDFDVRREAAVALGNFESCAQCALPFLITSSLADQDYDVRREAVKAICRISSASNSSVCALVQALDDIDVDVRKEAVIALREASPATRQQLLPEIIARLNDIDEGIRLNAVKTLAVYGSTCTPVCDALDRIAHEDKSLDIRMEATETLYELKQIQIEELSE